MAPVQIVFATGNAAKLAQLAFIITCLQAPMQVISARERYGRTAGYDEAGRTTAIIASSGALQVARRLGVPVITEDSAFYVDALGGRPGVRANQYLRVHGRAGILDELGMNKHRAARIVSAVAWAAPGGDSQTWVTSVPGQVAFEERALPGMPDWVGPSADNALAGGYNAIFIPRGERRTLAEIPPQEALFCGYREPNFCALLRFIQCKEVKSAC